MAAGSGPEWTPGRRRVLRWASAAGLSSLAAGRVRSRGSPEGGPPEPPQDDVLHRHVGRLETVRRQVRRYERTGDPTWLYDPVLAAHLDGEPPEERIDLVVRTVGERSVQETGGPADRTIHGWRPTDGEVETVARFGSVGFVGEVATTTIAVRNVAPEDVRAIADLPFVLAVGRDPPLAVDRPGTVQPDGGVPLAELRSSDYFRFSELPSEVSIPSWLRIGIVDRGYGGSGDFAFPRAAALGIDEDLARDFTDEGEWYDGDDHGSNVANTCAAMLPDGHDDLFVPLKVVPTGRTPSMPDVRDRIRAAIEYAEIHGIQVLNLSLGATGYQRTCPSTFCAELSSYVDAGYLPFAAVGNRDTSGVGFPGGEWLTIGVGGVSGTCGGASYERYVDGDGYYGSSYSTVRYHDQINDRTHCHFCRHRSGQFRGFSPSVYGCYRPRTEAGVTLWGSSYACPQAAAAGALALANEPRGYREVASLFRGMDRYGICPERAAREGQLLDAEYVYRETVDGGCQVRLPRGRCPDAEIP